MAESSSGATFRLARRGYDPHQVQERIDELTQQLSTAGAHAEIQRRRAEDGEHLAESERAGLRDLEGRRSLPDFDVVAQRVLSILEATDEAAAELRTRAEVEAAGHKREAEDHAAQSLAAARVQADAIVGHARRVAADVVAASDRRIAELAAEIARLEHQRDALLNALGGLHERLTQAAHDLVTTNGDGR